MKDLGIKPTPMGLPTRVSEEKVYYPSTCLQIPEEGFGVGQELELRFLAEVESVSKGEVRFSLKAVEIASGDAKSDIGNKGKNLHRKTIMR